MTKRQVRTWLDFTSGFSIQLGLKVRQKDMETLQSVLADNRFTVENTMSSLAQPCDEMVSKCRFEGVLKDCRSIFRSIKTFRGHCCSFNVRTG